MVYNTNLNKKLTLYHRKTPAATRQSAASLSMQNR